MVKMDFSKLVFYIMLCSGIILVVYTGIESYQQYKLEQDCDFYKLPEFVSPDCKYEKCLIVSYDSMRNAAKYGRCMLQYGGDE